MTQREASCACGQLRITAQGEPVRISVCHCIDCQRRTGSAFGVQARFPDDAVNIKGQATRYIRVADSGRQLSYFFCPECGSTVYYQLEAAPGFTAIPIGGFADPGFPPPRISIYESRQHPWLAITADVEHTE